MAEYKVIIEETVSKDFIVTAKNAEAARKIAEEKYKSCEFVLDPGNLISKRIAILPSKSDNIEWSVF